jgi:ketosteroid isomerase-like protein
VHKMTKFLIILPVVCLLASGCNQGSKGVLNKDGLNSDSLLTISIKDSLKVALMNVDKKWSDLSQKKGFYRSRLDFLTENSIDIPENKMPVEGKKNIIEYVLTHKDTTVDVMWTPLRAEVAASGEIGYTYGGWTMKYKTKANTDTTAFGSYITIWHKQPDGSWKYIFDGGSETPQPVTK